eukprot:scaffold18145_cov35-Tisochrysis_lutea.AAC.1
MSEHCGKTSCGCGGATELVTKGHRAQSAAGCRIHSQSYLLFSGRQRFDGSVVSSAQLTNEFCFEGLSQVYSVLGSTNN